MASVYLGRALGVGGFERVVAIKVMHPDLAADPAFVAMFLDEARLAARVRHPNVVATLDIQESGKGLFLVMEYVEGPSLSAVRRALSQRGETLPLGIALRIMLDALLGLHAAHEQIGADGEPLHIVHRDATPQNILVGVDGLTKITDFGVARAESRLGHSKTGSVKGKLAYMSPQQVRGEAVDRRADVYAAGVVLWELLVGRRLFAADNDGTLLYRVMAGVSQSCREAGAAIPESIDRAVMGALQLDVEARHPSALAFAEALETAAADASVPLATGRAVASFVKNLGAHQPLAIGAGNSDKDAAPHEPTTFTATDLSAPNEQLAPKLAQPMETPPEPVLSRSATISPTPARRPRSLVAIALACLGVGAILTTALVRGPWRAPRPSAPSEETSVAPASSGDAPKQARAVDDRGGSPEPTVSATSTASATVTAASSSRAPLAASSSRRARAAPVFPSGTTPRREKSFDVP
jgi:serine/threonine-protein kinase